MMYDNNKPDNDFALLSVVWIRYFYWRVKNVKHISHIDQFVQRLQVRVQYVRQRILSNALKKANIVLAITGRIFEPRYKASA